MAECIPWHGTNKFLKAPKERKADIQDIYVFNNNIATVSCWELTPEELADCIQAGGCIFVSVLAGPTSPPIFVGSEETVRMMLIDYGKVWPKEKIK